MNASQNVGIDAMPGFINRKVESAQAVKAQVERDIARFPYVDFTQDSPQEENQGIYERINIELKKELPFSGKFMQGDFFASIARTLFVHQSILGLEFAGLKDISFSGRIDNDFYGISIAYSEKHPSCFLQVITEKVLPAGIQDINPIDPDEMQTTFYISDHFYRILKCTDATPLELDSVSENVQQILKDNQSMGAIVQPLIDKGKINLDETEKLSKRLKNNHNIDFRI